MTFGGWMKTRTYFLSFLVLSVLLASGCGQKSGTEPASSLEVSSPAKETTPAKPAFDPSTAGTLKGKVSFDGTAPAPRTIPIQGNPECAAFHPDGKISSEELVVNEGGLQNVFVYIKEGLEGRHFDPPTDPVTIRNQKCAYVPHVSGVQVGQPVVLLNEDPTLHNIHSYSKTMKPWNLGLPFQGMKQVKKFESAEVMVTLKCDVHPWMIGYVGVLPHPYFAVTNSKGEFEIKNLPPGNYVVEAWHEKLGAQSQAVKIEPVETKEIEFEFTA